MFSHMLLMVIKFSVVRKRPRMMRGCCEYSRRSPCLFGLPYYLITRKARKGEEGKIQSQPEEPRAGQTTRRDSGEVPEKEPQSRLSRRNRERRGPEQVQSSPDGILPLSVTRERENAEGPDRSSGQAPESDFFLITRKRRQREEGGGQSQPEEPRGGQTTRRDSGEVPEKEPQSRQRRERPRRKLRRGPGVGWDWFSNSFPLVFLSEPIREPTK